MEWILGTVHGQLILLRNSPSIHLLCLLPPLPPRVPFPQAAVDSKPDSSEPYVVYVRSGRYKEQVTVPTRGLVLVGDGADRTTITEDFSVISDNITTFLTATFGAYEMDVA